MKDVILVDIASCTKSSTLYIGFESLPSGDGSWKGYKSSAIVQTILDTYEICVDDLGIEERDNLVKFKLKQFLFVLLQ